ncbi:MAG: DNA polymerase III subunit beta [Chlamydiae bacterium]|nr:DNA polymerase III subunit beta [Chlamydiota bacterium]
MKFIISLADLNKLLNKIQNVVPQKATIPILSNFLLEASGGDLILTATDLTVGIRSYTEAKVIKEGATTLPAKKFASLIRELTTPHIEIHTNEHDITEVIAGSSRFKLHGMNKSEFPSLPELAETTQFIIPQRELKNMLFRTSFAVSREDNRYVLTGVFIKIQNGKATFTGTDGKRLAKNEIGVSLDPSWKGDYIIPLKAVEEITKNLNEEGDATIYLMKDKIAIEANQSILITKLLCGDYPDINRIIPEKMETHVSLHREELMTLLRQVSLFTSNDSQSVRFSFTNGELKLSANAMEVGEGHVSMPVNYNGENLDIAFNPHYFLDVLRHTSKETVDLGIIDAFNPVVIKEELEGEKPDDSLCLIMPMRLDQPV